MSVPALSRRSALRGLLVAGVSAVAGYVLARASDAADPSRATAAANAYGPADGAADGPIARVDDIPVSGGIVLDDKRVVLTRDEAGMVRGRSATCTHQGCTVSSVDNGVISCPCHGSSFDVQTGAPTAGPASRPLPEVPVTVRDGSVFRA